MSANRFDEPRARLRRARRRLAARLASLRGETVVRPSLPAGSLDEPADGGAVPRWFVRVRGWAMTADGPADRVELTLDGEPVALARLCCPRPDLVHELDDEHAMLGGFEHVLDLTGVDPGKRDVVLAATAVGSRGERFELGAARLPLVAHEDPLDDPEGRAPLLVERSLRPVTPLPARRGGEAPHLLVVTHDLNLGGGQLVLQNMLERWAQAGVTGAVVAPRDGVTRRALEAAGFPVHIRGDYLLDGLEPYEGQMAELVAWAAPQGFDAVLVNTAVAFVGGDLAGRLGLPATWIVHESYGLDGFWATFPEQWLNPHVRERGVASFRAAKAVIFEADATRRLFERDAADGACLTIPYGIDVAALDAWRAGWTRARARREMGFGEDEPVILCVGTIEPRKGQTQLVEAFARVASQHPGARLVLLGSRDDGHERAPQIAAEQHGLTDRVEILRVMRDVRPAYLAADLLVCASDVESLPRSVLEAMAIGLPVLGTDVFGVPEVVHDGESGWICRQRDTGALAETLARALATPRPERERLAAAARAIVEREHELGSCAARYLAVVRAVAAGRSVTAVADA